MSDERSTIDRLKKELEKAADEIERLLASLYEISGLTVEKRAHQHEEDLGDRLDEIWRVAQDALAPHAQTIEKLYRGMPGRTANTTANTSDAETDKTD